MIQIRHKIACAPIAIAAMAALNTTAAAAQDAPTAAFDVPAPMPIASSAPAPIARPAPQVIEAPTPAPLAIDLPEPMPVIDPPIVAEAEPVASTQTTRSTATKPQPKERTAARQFPSEAPAVSSDRLAEPLASSRGSEIASMAATGPVAQAEPAAIPAPAEEPLNLALLLGLFGLGGAGLAGFLLLRSRSRRRADEVPVIERPLIADRAPSVKPVGAEPTDGQFDLPPLGQASRFPVASSEGVAVELPPELPASRAERGRLLQRMIAAKPDRANPFASPKARAKRARLILQSIGTHFTDRKPGIDLSQYTNVWPELRGWRPASA